MADGDGSGGTQDPPSGAPPKNDGAPPAKTYTEADLQGLRAKNDELLGKLKSKDARLAILGERSDEEIKADLELAAKTREAKAKAEGDFESLKAQMADAHKLELGKREARIQKVEGKLHDVLAKREVEAAIVAAGGNPKLLLPHVLPNVRVLEVDDDFVAQVVDAKGKPRIADGQATPMSIEQLVETFKADEAYGTAFAKSVGNGSGARNGGAPSGAAGKILIPKSASPQEYRRLKEQAEKEGREYAVAEA